MNPCTDFLPSALKRRNSLVEAHRHLVPPLARHYWRRTPEPQDDLIQAGMLGLIRAAELFSPSHETPFAAFARPHIRGAILHYLRDDAPAVRLPRRQSELQSRLQKLQEQMAQSPLEARNLSMTADLTADQWQLLERHRRLCRPLPLDGALEEQLASPSEDPQEDTQETLERVESLLAALEPRTRQVVQWVVLQGWSYRQAAAALHVSAMTVQRCLHRGLETLRNQLKEAEADRCIPRVRNPGRRIGPASSVARGWPSRHSPPPAAAPVHRARR